MCDSSVERDCCALRVVRRHPDSGMLVQGHQQIHVRDAVCAHDLPERCLLYTLEFDVGVVHPYRFIQATLVAWKEAGVFEGVGWARALLTGSEWAAWWFSTNTTSKYNSIPLTTARFVRYR